ncbi:MAG: alpha/beta hydrolase [Anaerolineae bacterium]|nr:alpha/beta hydrolase [Anaerolineae bacterium]
MSNRPSETILDLTPPRAAERVSYGAEADHIGDLWLPSSARESKPPLLVFFHGGYWRARYDLEHASFACQALAGEEIAVWNVEYRRSEIPGGGWPGTFEDVLAALSYLPRLAELYPLDLQRVVFCGHSAGGHLALWAAAQAARDAVAVPGLRGVLALAPVSDLHDAWGRHLSQDAVVGLLGGTPADVGDRYDAASPVRLLPLRVPQALIHGTADPAVPFAMSEQYVSRATAAGDHARLIPLEGYGHFEVIDPWSSVWPAVVEELKRLLAAKA